MFFGLGGVFYVTILITNAICILSEDRFLARIGWGTSSPQTPGFGSQDAQSVKAKVIHLMASIRTLARIPLIAINTLVILYELVLG